MWMGHRLQGLRQPLAPFIANVGTITNANDGTITNDGPIANGGTITNDGIMANGGTSFILESSRSCMNGGLSSPPAGDVSARRSIGEKSAALWAPRSGSDFGVELGKAGDTTISVGAEMKITQPAGVARRGSGAGCVLQ